MDSAPGALPDMEPAVTPVDASLLSSAAHGDADAFAVFYRRHVPAVTGLAVRLGTAPNDVADVVSETFLIALERAGRYVQASDTARPWLLGIAWRVAQRGFRQRVRQFRLHRRLGSTIPRFNGDEAETIAAAIDASRMAPDLAAALRRLPRGERRVLELMVGAGLTPTEVAVALDISSNAARLRLARARQRLRAHLGTNDLSAAIEAREAPA
jgi:RNA polymerase sigma-70 factor, ECF subfamily